MKKTEKRMVVVPSRMTRQRRVVFEELSNVKTHPTADQVYEMVRRRLPRISLSTVYRNLELLARTGKVLRLNMDGEQRRYDADTSQHEHVYCLKCGRVDDVPGVEMPNVEKIACGRTNYDIMGYRLKFLGICPQCKRLGRSAARDGDKAS